MTRVDREGPIHRAILTYLRTQYPDALIHHSPNETDLRGKDVARAIAKQKGLGMAVGFPDLLMVWRGYMWGFEVKAEGNYASTKQKDVGVLLENNGAKWAVVRSIDDVRECIAEWTKRGPIQVIEVPVAGRVLPCGTVVYS